MKAEQERNIQKALRQLLSLESIKTEQDRKKARIRQKKRNKSYLR